MEFVWVSGHTWRYSVFLRFLSTPQTPCHIAVWSHWGRCRNGWIGILSSSIFPITGRLKALQRCSGLVPSQDCFLDRNLTASKKCHILLLRCTAKHLSHTRCGISTSSLVRLRWPSPHSWASPLAPPVSWCHCDIMNLKSLMCSSRHRASSPNSHPVLNRKHCWPGWVLMENKSNGTQKHIRVIWYLSVEICGASWVRISKC